MTDVLAETPILLQRPTNKERKYDRQLRLWAASGQAALEAANILLINSGSGTVGVETLKNLVLPGIGKFTIADAAIVEDVDLGVNFFLDHSCLGKSRARCCAEALVELNPEVTGNHHPESPGHLRLKELLEKPDVFSMIMYALPLPPDQISLIEEYGRLHRIPLIAVHSVGFYAYFRTTLPGIFPIVDTHPDETATADLRLLSPWPELSEFANTMAGDIDNMDHHEHGHVPMVVILLHYLEEWKESHQGLYPTAYTDKTAFRSLVSRATRRDNPEGGEENFEEAAAAVMKHVNASTIPSTLQEVFDYRHPDPQERVKSSFWIIADAVRDFYVKHKQLPVAGGLPDMKAQSSVYLKLQNLYKDKARRDAHEVLETVRKSAGGKDIPSTEVELFCKNARFIKLINKAKDYPVVMSEVVERELANDELAALAGPEMPMSLIPIYLALTASSNKPHMSADEIVDSVRKAAPSLHGNERTVEIAREVARAAGGELHNISAVMGGMVAQEVIKIITQQYVPIDNTCIFDGIESRCQVVRL